MRKSVIICLPNAFSYGWLGSTNRLFNICNALIKLGFDVHVFSQGYEEKELQEAIENEFPGTVHRYESWLTKSKFKFFHSFSNKVQKVLWRLRGKNIYFSKLSYGWSDKVNIKSLIGVSKLSTDEVSLVWGICGGKLDGINLANRVAQELNVPWVIELHDPPIGADIKIKVLEVEEKYRFLLNSADVIIPTTKTYADLIIDKYYISQSKVNTIFLTYNKSKIAHGKSRDINSCWSFCYAGTLKGKRTLLPFIEAISEIINDNPEIREIVKIKLAGAGDGFDDVLRLADKKNIMDNIDFLGLLSADEATELQNSCDILLLVQPNENRLEIPGKIFHILASEKQVLGLMDKEIETAEILIKSGVGNVVAMNDISSIKESILSLWKNKDHGALCNPNVDYITSFSEERLPDHIEKVLEKVNVRVGSL